MNKKQIADYLLDTIDWNAFYSLVDTVGKTMNEAKDRFEKSDLFEGALEAYSDGRIKYVNHKGVDHLLPELDSNLEMKYSTSGLFKVRKKTGITMYDTIGVIRLVNTNTDKIPTELPSGYAQYLLLVDLNGAAVIDVETLKQYLYFGAGFIEARNIPIDKFEIIVSPDSMVQRSILPDFNYKEAKKQFQIDFLNKVRTHTNSKGLDNEES